MARLVRTFQALDPRDPSGIQTRILGLEQAQLEALLHEDGKANDTVRLYRLKLAMEVGQGPFVVFEDWMRPEHSDGLCYCGSPKRDYPGRGKDVPAPPGMVFCVYAKPSGKMTRWDWEPRDSLNPDYPENWDTRFGRILWPPPQAT